MLNKKNYRRFLALGLAVALTASSICVNTPVEAASAKKVKSITLKIGKKKVTKKTYSLTKGKTAKIKVTVKPAKAKKSVTFKTSNKKVATVTKKGVVKAKKKGTAKITVTVKGKNNKKKKTWVKIKVTKKKSTTATKTPSATATPNPTPTPTAAPVEITLDKTEVSNPIGGYDTDGNLMYGGDPSVLVDGDTIYLYTGHDTAQSEAYEILEWMCYSTKDLKNWKYEGVIMKADKASIPWANTGTDAWAGQMVKYNNKYYFYHCTWDSTASGKQSIGVAVSNSPTGPFVDLGEPLVKGTVTTGQTSDWNDIDPTVWIEEDKNGVEHRYLSWGNGKHFICELNEDMVSIKDINNDGNITFGTQASGKTSADVDILEQTVSTLTFTEAPWLYRRKDANGKPYGQYYLFYAYGWREQMAYATTDDIFNGTWQFGSVLMEPAVTSNTNHAAVFDFNGKTYFVYHNGSLPGGSGFRRNACIAELKFNEDGSVKPIPETAIGITGATPYTISSNGTLISHASFANSSADSDYPYKDVEVGAFVDPETADAQWAIVDGKYVPANGNTNAYVSIQSENKPGLYLTVNDGDTVTLAQDSKYSVVSGKIVADTDTAKAQTFRTVSGLNGDANGVSFESVAKPGYYLTLSGGSLVITDGSNNQAATFKVSTESTGSSVTPTPGTGTDTSIASMIIGGTATTAKNNTYTATAPYDAAVVKAQFALTDKNAYAIVNGKKTFSSDTIYITLTGKTTDITVTVYASNAKTTKDYTITITKNNPSNLTPVSNTNLFKTFNFDDITNGASAVTKASVPTAVSGASYTYVDGKNGKAIQLDGTYGLKLCDGEGIGSTYTVSYWMKPTTLKGSVDPTLCGGTFNPESWFNLTYIDRYIWSKQNGSYIDTTKVSDSSYQADVWQHVALVVDGSSSNLYLNGELLASGNIASDVFSADGAALYFGVNAWDAYYEGALDEIAIFNRALSEAEIQTLAFEGTFVNNLTTP